MSLRKRNCGCCNITFVHEGGKRLVTYLVVSMVFLCCNHGSALLLRTAFPTLLVVLISFPQDANLRGVFLLKLSTASTTASDVVKLCLIVLQVELLSFCAVHTEAHADVAASWCCALADAAISLDSDASWKRASRAVSGAIVSLIAEFRGKFIDDYLPSGGCFFTRRPDSGGRSFSTV